MKCLGLILTFISYIKLNSINYSEYRAVQGCLFLEKMCKYHKLMPSMWLARFVFRWKYFSSGHNSMKTAGSSHEKSILIKSGVECVDWSEMMTWCKMHISLPPLYIYAISLHCHGWLRLDGFVKNCQLQQKGIIRGYWNLKEWFNALFCCCWVWPASLCSLTSWDYRSWCRCSCRLPPEADTGSQRAGYGPAVWEWGELEELEELEKLGQELLLLEVSDGKEQEQGYGAALEDASDGEGDGVGDGVEDGEVDDVEDDV